MRLTRNIKIALIALILTGATGQIAFAQQEPPIKIKGFAYRFIERGQIHMNDCARSSCVAGSKVSYTIGAPDGKPDFKRFKDNQKAIAAYLKTQAS
ncbi:MAG: hypothetical protein OER56_14780, partial [Hyphomicrobiales bacterium]|nr:hypothetical protein [Hyphomicrobiales bacterium]